MRTIRQACVPRPATFDPARRDTVLDLSDLIADRIAPVAFFAENHITEGMRTLLTQGFRRLEGKSTQGFFKLTQAMGGGKTHNLLALGLLARHPEWRVDEGRILSGTRIAIRTSEPRMTSTSADRKSAGTGCVTSCPTTGRNARRWRRSSGTWLLSRSTTGAKTPLPRG